ncbi:MAG: rod shape-determining protein RodA [Actinobacteria bacterium]|nr:rod shape-determining protein RodA [Actinomycetota bacterium]
MPTASQFTGRRIKGMRSSLSFANLPLLGVVLALVVYGLVVVSSATQGLEEYSLARQLFGVGLGIVFMVLFWRLDYRKISHLIVPMLIVDVLLLLSPHFPLIGVTAKGATSWINLFGLQVQPGEPAKIVSILLIAAIVAQYRGSIDSGREYLKVLGLCSIPFICIMTQPDLGTGLVMLIIAASVLFVGGANRKWLLLTCAVCITMVAMVLFLDPILDARMGTDVFLKDYQMNRLLVFIDPSLDPTGAGYNLEQAKIAIGSGGLTGKGLGNGTQSAMGFLPEAPTDFIFCVIGEELGFLGASGLLVLYLLLFIVAFDIASRSFDLFGSLVVAGIVGMWIFQVLENIGMCCGLMPITGIPLPFMSYGSSFMLTNFMAMGLLLSIWRHRIAPSA